MITFTKEQLIASAHARIEFAEMMLAGELEPLKERTWTIELELARIALASLEAEPVFEVEVSGNHWLNAGPVDDSDFSGMPDGVNQLYSTPPSPVSVPEWTNEQCLEFLSIAFRHAEIKGDLELDDIRLGVKMVNGSRAAMLQGADGNSPVIPVGWLMVPVEPTPEMQSAAAGAIRFDTTPINKLWTGNAVYRAMLAAAPQQEVK